MFKLLITFTVLVRSLIWSKMTCHLRNLNFQFSLFATRFSCHEDVPTAKLQLNVRWRIFFVDCDRLAPVLCSVGQQWKSEVMSRTNLNRCFYYEVNHLMKAIFRWDCTIDGRRRHFRSLRADYFYCLFIVSRLGILRRRHSFCWVAIITKSSSTQHHWTFYLLRLIVTYRPFYCRRDNWSVCLSRRAEKLF